MPLKPSLPRSSSCSDITRMKMDMKLSSLATDTPATSQKDDGSISIETKKTRTQIPPTSNHFNSLRSHQPPNRSNHLSQTQSWYSTQRTASLDEDLPVQPKHSEREKIKERSRKRQPSKHSSKLFENNTLDSAEMDQIQIIDDDKVQPFVKNIHWWHALFFFSAIGLLVCLLQLLLPPPYGLMMTSTEVAEVGVAPGCDDDMQRCVCPRKTICATDKLSLILLALARCFAFFDYPLYMMLFLSKAHNLNNHSPYVVARMD